MVSKRTMEKMTFKERAKVAMELLAKQKPVTLKQARAQVLWMKVQSQNPNKGQEIKHLLKMYHVDWTQEQIDDELIRLKKRFC